ncbi:restriction endonuclease subunit S [Extibacter muris]|uniref:restriction endonuclease subunit S n=1 Tax=Extibacter muris TaxID=1796622 RepID=UPI001D060DCA|nr:restriction endonuclease subunit S [Extibacter muris]MCB6200996.1 restriction endonuclease subunit S [Extibacter muris]MCQ4662326.1 restriction endonuclease subunit S [Extibacter muris]MCQ4691747.1 restriction endonuclease subunit S [Extibacter muris]
MKKYEEYKSISLPWLNEIPSHWEVRRNKNIFTEMKEEVGVDAPQYTLLSMTLKGIIPRDMNGGGKFPEQFDKYKIVKKGNMAFCLFDVDETPRTVGLSNYDGMLTGAYTIMRIKNINPQYVFFYYLSLDNVKALKPLYTGLRKTININTFQSTKIPIPPRTEQDQIVKFLDWKITEINKLIAIKTQQIKVYKEFLTAEIELQLHKYPVIKTMRLKSLGRFEKGGGFSRDNLLESDGNPAILYGDIYTKYKYKTNIITHMVDVAAYYNAPKVSKGDIVFAGTGETKDEIGKPILYYGDETVAVGGDVIIFHTDKSINAEYILFHLYSQKSLQCRYIKSKGDIIVHIYPKDLGDITIPMISNKNKDKVVAAINLSILRIEKIISILKSEIDTLHEFKTRLISDVVIGQIDVRDIKIPD